MIEVVFLIKQSKIYSVMISLDSHFRVNNNKNISTDFVALTSDSCIQAFCFG